MDRAPPYWDDEHSTYEGKLLFADQLPLQRPGGHLRGEQAGAGPHRPHGVCATATLEGVATLDAYDHRFCWKVFDALQSAAFFGTNARYALGDIPEHRSHGTWSDGVPVVPLTIQESAPLVP